MLRGLDFFLLPDFLKDLVQPGGYETMLTERDAWFHSNACFIRDGVTCLLSLKKQQQLGMDLLAALAEGGDGKYDDYLPSTNQSLDTKPNLGSSRRHIASDQAMRAGNIFDPNHPQVGLSSIRVMPCSTPVSGLTGQAVSNLKDDPELSDTDDEDHQQKRRRRTANGRGRRRHLLAPSTARTKVMLSQGRMASQSIKTEGGLHQHQEVKPVLHPKIEMNEQPPSFLNPNVTTMEDTKPSLKPIPKFRVDSLHLAALMAVGTSPPSSP
jgi:hypothetical protein